MSIEDKEMRAVHFWKCDCGVRLRAITQGSEKERSIAVCPACKKEVAVEGALLEVAYEKEQVWQNCAGGSSSGIRWDRRE